MLCRSAAVEEQATGFFALLDGGKFWPDDWGPLILLAVGSQVVGQGLMIYAMGHLPPMVIGLGLLLQPFISAVIGRWQYGEGMGALDIIGQSGELADAGWNYRFLRSRANTIEGGTSEILKNIVAERVLGLAKSR